MVSVKFNLKDKKSKNKTLIFARVYYNNLSFKTSTGYSVDPANWNDEKQRLRVVSGKKHLEKINSILNAMVVKIEKVYLSFEEKGIQPTTTQFKEKLKSYGQRVTLNSYFEVVRKRKLTAFGLNAAKRYKTTLGHLNAFSKLKKRTYDFEDIDINFYNDFLDYFYSIHDSSANDVGKHIGSIIAVLNEATDDGYNKNLFFKSGKFKKPSQEVDSIYLNTYELELLYKHKVKDKKLEKVKDYFLIGSFTALRYSDFSKLNDSNLKTIRVKKKKKFKKITLISIRSKKTNTKTSIPLHRYVKSIIDKYTIDGMLKLPPPMSNQKMNDYLKVLCKNAGIISQVEVIKSIKGKPVKKKFLKYELVSTHTARRSAASNMVLAGIPIKAIMLLGGWKTERSFNSYVRISTEENAIAIAGSSFFS